MDHQPASPEIQPHAESFGASLAGFLKQLLVLVRRRKALLATGLVLVYGLGVLYYCSRDFVYQARASVLVHRAADSIPGKAGEVAEGRHNYLPTHLRLLTGSAVLEKALHKLKANKANPHDWPAREALAAGLSVSAQKDTEILEIAYQTTDRSAAAVVVEAVVSAYLDFVNETHRSTSKDVLQILTQQKADLDRQLQAKEAQLLTFQQSAGVLSMRDEKNNVLVSRVQALDQSLTQARVKRLECEVRHRALLAAIARGEPIDVCLVHHFDKLGKEKLAAGLGIKPANEADRRDLQRDQLELQRLEAVYGPNHPKMQVLAERVRLLRQSLNEDHQDPAQKAAAERDLQALAVQIMENDVKEAATLENELLLQFEAEKAKVIEFNARNAPFLALETELNRLRSFHETINQRIRQVNLGGDYDVITTQVIEPPQEPHSPVAPDLRKILLACTALGLLLGLSLCYVFEWWDTGYRGPEDIAQHLGLPICGHVPWLTVSNDDQPFELIMHHAAQSVEAEAFRTMRTMLMLCDAPPKKFTITSPEPGDGKTSILTNLAIAFAQSGMRTLLIDADLRRPRLRQIFNVPHSTGLSQLLQRYFLEEEHLREAICSTPIDKLDVLPGGPNPPNPTELLTSERFAQVLAWADAHYDRIICDAPPILAVSDCALLGRLLDGALLVVRADKSDRVLAARARDALRGMNCPVLGVVVNGLQSGDSYGYAYYRNVSYYTSNDDDNPDYLRVPASQESEVRSQESGVRDC